jgi:hypothetical protein
MAVSSGVLGILKRYAGVVETLSVTAAALCHAERGEASAPWVTDSSLGLGMTRDVLVLA